jgi:CubicO group peptidase (beta-lactamase class C family)
MEVFAVGVALLIMQESRRVAAQSAPLEGFDAYVQQAVRDWEAPGLAIAVVKDGKLVFAKGYGVRALGKSDPVDIHTLFAIGSTTKAMTAAAIGMLVDEGKLSWDDPVTKYLPAFQLYDPYVTREVTVRDLLTHRAGLGNANFLWYRQENNTSEILYRLRYLKPQTSMRSRFIYQNIMYAAAGEVIAAVSGMSWAKFIQTRLFNPLAMTETVPMASMLAQPSNVASPHFKFEDTVRLISNASVDEIAAAGAIWSSVNDMSKWMRFLLNGGRTDDGKELLSKSTYTELFAPQVIVTEAFYPTVKLTRPHWMTYGLGWFQEDYSGRAVDFHTGSIDGMIAIIGLIRDENLGVYVLANLDHAEVRHALMYRVFDLYGKSPFRDWSKEFRKLYADLHAETIAKQKEAEKERVAGTAPSVQLQQYAGAYSDSLYGAITVAFDGMLQLQYGSGGRGALEHWNYDTFRVQWEAKWRDPAFVSFTLDRKGQPMMLDMSDMEFKRVEPKEAKKK